MKRKKTVCFTGYRPHKLPFGYNENHPNCIKLKEVLKKEIEKTIIDGFEHFICGFGLGVDMLCAQIVLDLKEIYRHITLESAIPCETQAVRWSNKDREKYYSLLSKCDKETLLEYGYTPEVMKNRNKYMVDNSDMVIAVYDGKLGGTMQTVGYARLKDKQVICIDPFTFEISNI